MLVHVVAPGFEYPAGATVTNPPPSMGAEIVVLGAPAGNYACVWFRTTDGLEAGRGSGRAGEDGRLVLSLPAYTDELVGHVFSGPRLRAEQTSGASDLALWVDGVRTGDFRLERADAISGGWVPWNASPGWNGTSTVVRVPKDGLERGFFRARWTD